MEAKEVDMTIRPFDMKDASGKDRPFYGRY